ncbi:conjugal transfer protein TraM [Fluoribacter gormanii]|uniref:conjugal transfer protein TraM n=1 Tax=Fluoribacter gormanii TaxID=464 RepID=UPI001040F43C|nr:conjugal transfer protein TraM [Fluoribacter gormanii]
MTDKFDGAIQEIAVKHGVVLSKDDPILILQTMNNRLIEETRQAQAVMLAQFREEMENISSQWKDDAKIKAEKVLNAALASSKETMTKLSQEYTRKSVQEMKEMIVHILAEAGNMTQRTRKFSVFILLLTTTILIISCFLSLLSTTL